MPPGLLGLKTQLADKLVFAKIRERLGGRFQCAVSGGAPLGRDVAEFFWGAGMPIYEGYGLTETSPVLTVNAPRRGQDGHRRHGRSPASSCASPRTARSSPAVPTSCTATSTIPTATAEVIDGEGWFHTGDIGQIDGDGFLTITDRKKELIVNAYGKNIAPAPIENGLKSDPLIGQAVVIGDKRPFLHRSPGAGTSRRLRAWAQRQGLTAKDDAALVRESEVRALFAKAVEHVNTELARYEQVRAFELLPRRVHARDRRADADTEGEAAGHPEEVRRGDRASLSRRSRPADGRRRRLPARGRRRRPRHPDLRPAGQGRQHLQPAGGARPRADRRRARAPHRHPVSGAAVGQAQDLHRRRRHRRDRRRHRSRPGGEPGAAHARRLRRLGVAALPHRRRDSRHLPRRRHRAVAGLDLHRLQRPPRHPHRPAGDPARHRPGLGRLRAPAAPHRDRGGARHHPHRQDARSPRRPSRSACSTRLFPDAAFLHLVREFALAKRGRASARTAAPTSRNSCWREIPWVAKCCSIKRARRRSPPPSGHYPAPLRAIEVVRVGIESGRSRRLRRRGARRLPSSPTSPVCEEPDPRLPPDGGVQEGRGTGPGRAAPRRAPRRCSAPASWAAASAS